MNCKITHSESTISFYFDHHKGTDTQTMIVFNKDSKRFRVTNMEEYYGYGYTLIPKQFNYFVKYLEKGGFL